MDNLTDLLEIYVNEILAKLKKVNIKKTIVIEISGTPKSGKTTYVESLKVFLRRKGIKVRSIQEGACICPVEDKNNLFFNIWTMTHALNSLVENIYAPVPYTDILIIERGLFDSICWFKWFKEKGSLNDDEYKILTDFITIDKFTSLIDIVCAFKVDADISLIRENESVIVPSSGTIMNNKTINQINCIIDEVVSDFSINFNNKILKINTSNYTILEKNIIVTKEILENILKILSYNEKGQFV